MQLCSETLIMLIDADYAHRRLLCSELCGHNVRLPIGEGFHTNPQLITQPPYIYNTPFTHPPIYLPHPPIYLPHPPSYTPLYIYHTPFIHLPIYLPHPPIYLPHPPSYTPLYIYHTPFIHLHSLSYTTTYHVPESLLCCHELFHRLLRLILCPLNFPRLSCPLLIGRHQLLYLLT